jgi:hypothetical protein
MMMTNKKDYCVKKEGALVEAFFNVILFISILNLGKNDIEDI